MSANDHPLQTSRLKTGSIPMFSKVKALGIDIPATLRGRASLADQFGLRRTVLIQNICARRFTNGIARPYSAEPSVLSSATQR